MVILVQNSQDIMIGEETQLATRAAHDTEALAELFDVFYERVFTYARYRCDDEATADDLTAQIFEKVITHIGQYNAERGPFAPWLFTIARNVVNDHWRRKRRHRWVSLERLREVPSPETDVEAHLIQCEEEEALLAALNSLDTRERDILGLKFAARLTNRAIARTTGLRESHVGVIVYRALGKLHKIMEETS